MKATLVRNAALIALALAAAGPALPDAGGTAPAAQASTRNLLLVTIDTLRPDRLSPYDKYNAQTPAAAGLAARGALFEAAYANSPITLPSHAGMMLGTPPPVHGVSENSHTRVPDGPPTLAEEMKKSGRETAAFVGAFPLDSRFGLDRGFDLYDDKFPARPSSLSTFSERRADKVVAAASAWLASRKGPWFCWVHLWDPHTPYDPPPPFRDKYKNDPYSGEAAYADSELGRLLDGLAARGTLNDTFVVLTSDHGESLGEHGELTHSYFAYDSTLRVPLIIAGPGLRPLRIKEPVSHIDLLPTVCDLLGLQAPAGLPGRSLAPALQGKALTQHPIYIEAMDAALNKGCAPLRGLIDRGRKYLETPIPELYDLAKDPGETSNLADKTDLAPYKKAFRDYLAGLPRPAAPGSSRPLDAAARSRLLSLGYVTASGTPLKASYGPEDDVKTFQPLQHDLETAILLLDRGQSDESLAGLQALIRKRPDFIPAYTVMTQLHLLQGRPREALLVMREAYLKNPENYTVLSSFGTLLVQEGQWESAVEVIGKALAKKDFDPEAWNNLGFAWWKKGDVVKALEYMHKAEVLDPTFAPAPSHMGAVFQYLYYAQGRKPDDLRRSIDYFRRAGEIDPTFNLAFRGLGVSLKEDGRTAEAEAAWSKALQADPNDLFSLLARGEARLLLGRKAEARADLERFLAASGGRITAEEKARVQALLEQAKR